MESRALLKELQGTMSVTEISRSTGIPRTTVREFYEREARNIQEVIARDNDEPAPAGVYFDNPVRPLSIEMPPVVTVERDGPVRTALLYGDTQFPFQDDGALSIVQQITRALQPDTIVHMGDLVDCYTISDYDRDPHRRFNLQDEINMARAHLAGMRLIAPDAAFHLLEGNHEDRLRRLLWRLSGPASELLNLDIIKRDLTWPTLLGLPELGISFYKYDGQQAHAHILPKFTLIHGNLVRKFGGYSARGEMEKYGTSGASGHCHRLGLTAHAKLDGSYIWAETGCTCKLDAEYSQNPDWQHGCVVATFDTETGAPSLEPVYIYNGLAVWRGNIYRA
jgi:hypothetical protein